MKTNLLRVLQVTGGNKIGSLDSQMNVNHIEVNKLDNDEEVKIQLSSITSRVDVCQDNIETSNEMVEVLLRKLVDQSRRIEKPNRCHCLPDDYPPCQTRIHSRRNGSQD
jgi:hypothetical protein